MRLPRRLKRQKGLEEEEEEEEEKEKEKENIRRVLEENTLSEQLGASKAPCIARLRYLENHAEAVHLYLMN